MLNWAKVISIPIGLVINRWVAKRFAFGRGYSLLLYNFFFLKTCIHRNVLRWFG